MRLRLLTLNLHCWQEPDAERKLAEVAAAIAELGIDVVALQEVGEPLRDPERNAARVIQRHLREHGLAYDFAWDWPHIGFHRWREGLAVLVRGRVLAADSRYVTRSHERKLWKSRMALTVDLQTETGARLTLVNTHLGWFNDREEPFTEQWQRLLAGLPRTSNPVFIAGDLNQPAGGPGHALIAATPGLVDCDVLDWPTFPGDIAGWEGEAGSRIDYVLRLGPGPDSVASQRLFTDGERPMVSDHYAVCVDFDWPEPPVAGE